MPLHVSTNAHDPMPWVSTECLGWDPAERSIAQRLYLDDLVEVTPDRRDLLGPPAPHRSWACVHRNHGVCPAARIDCSCRCHLA